MMDDLLQEMIDPAPVHRDAPRRRRLWTTVAIVGLAAVGATTLTTSALFTDNDSANASIETGTVDLAIGKDVNFAFTPQNLAPGSSTYVPVNVKSNGSLALRYAVYYQASVVPNGTPDPTLDPAPIKGDLRKTLQLSVFDNIPSAQCTEDAFPAGATPLPSANGVSNWPDTFTKLVGDKATGKDDGDRRLLSGGQEWLCFKVYFPIGATNEFQDTAVKLDLAFNAEQTVNNGD